MNHDHTAMLAASALGSTPVANRIYPMDTSAHYASTSLWKQTLVARDTAGGTEAFSIGPDGDVWSYVTSGVGHASGRLIPTGLQAQRFALASVEGGRKLLVGASEGVLRWVLETGGPSPRWHAPVGVEFGGLQGAAEITEVHSVRMDEDVLIGVLARYENKIGPDSYRFWVGKWTGSGLFFRGVPVDLNSDDPVAAEFLFQNSSAQYA
jgi:hypothetical protein